MAKEENGRNQFHRKIVCLFFLFIGVSMAKSAVQEDESSLFEFAQSLLQESVQNQNTGSGLNVLSGMVQGLMQTDGGKQLSDALAKGGSGGALDLITNLASLWQASKFSTGRTDDSGNKQSFNFDPSLVESMVDVLSTFNKVSSNAENNNVDENNNDEGDTKKTKLRTSEKNSVNWDAILSFASTMISSMSNQGTGTEQGSGGGLESFLSFLPVIMNSISGQHNHHSSHSVPHHTHSQFLPPFLENLHEYWDHFLATDFGKTLWKSSGLSDLVKKFTNEAGEIQTEKIFESLENNTFRRQWIKSWSSFVAEWLKYFTNPEVQKSYLETGQVVCNSFLKAQGFPKESFLDFKKPAKSISALINAIFKRHFDLLISSENYVGPAVAYVQELFKAGHRTGLGFFRTPSADLESKLSQTMEAEVIEPILRSFRAYKFALRNPGCAGYVICLVNQKGGVVKSGLKPVFTKGSSLVASWFLSQNDSAIFWNLYTAASANKSCLKYNKNCSDFDIEDIKATTEYYHNEL